MFCRNCTNPGREFGDIISIGQDGLCTLCSDAPLEMTAHLGPRLNECDRNMRDMLSARGSTGGYDCLLMWSGGKDSSYMLYLLKEKFGMNVLAYTYDFPLESRFAEDNIRLAQQHIDVPYIKKTDWRQWRDLIAHVLFDMESPINHRAPCNACYGFQMINAAWLAHQMGIRYVVYCADPNQAMYLSPTFRHCFDTLALFLGRDAMRYYGVPYLQVGSLKEDELPVLVLPYYSKEHESLLDHEPTLICYDQDVAIDTVKSRNLYESKVNRLLTHCDLLPLLDWWAMRHYHTCFYAREFADVVRAAENPEEVRTSLLDLLSHERTLLDELSKRSPDSQKVETLTETLSGYLAAFLRHSMSEVDEEDCRQIMDRFRNIKQLVTDGLGRPENVLE